MNKPHIQDLINVMQQFALRNMSTYTQSGYDASALQLKADFLKLGIADQFNWDKE